MRTIWKGVGVMTLMGIMFRSGQIFADTGDTTGTGNSATGTVITGAITTGTTATGEVNQFTGSLLDYLNTQETAISSLLTTAYGQVYTAFIKTGLNILKSMEYQSLVCLGAMQNTSLLAQIQKDRTSLTTAFKKDFVELENLIMDLEEKKALQDSDNVNVFDAGTTYESEKTRIKSLIDEKVKLHKGFIATYITSYLAKNTEFFTTYLQYRVANADLIKTITDKIAKVQGVLTAFSGVESTIASINAKITGLDDLMNKIDESKTKGLSNLTNTMQTLIDSNISKYKALQRLVTELTKQKTYVLGQFQTDLNQYLSDTFQPRYNRTQYLSLKEEVNAFKAKFYVSANQLNCTNILGTTTEMTGLLVKIGNMKAAANSGLAKISADGVSSSFKDQFYSGFQSLFLQKFKQRYAEFTDYIKGFIKSMYANAVTPSTSTGTIAATGTTEKLIYTFTRPYKSGEYAEGIKILQKLLTRLKLYTGAIDGIYNQATKKAVYQFQLNNGLLKGYENKPSVWGWMGPATRAALNKLTK